MLAEFIPFLPLIEALVLYVSTSSRLWWRDHWQKKGKKPDGIVGKAAKAAMVYLFKEEEKKHNVHLVLVGPWGMRAHIDMLPPRSGVLNSKENGNDVVRAIKLMHKPWFPLALYYEPRVLLDPYTLLTDVALLPFPRVRAFFYLWTLLWTIGETGAVNDLSEYQHRWVQICMICYKSSIRGDIYIPWPDFASSNFRTLDIRFRVPSDYLYREMFVHIARTLEQVFGCAIMIEQPPGEPGTVRIYPVGKVNRIIEVQELAPPTDDTPAIEDQTPVDSIWRLGHTISGKIGQPIEVDFLEVLNETQFLGIGGPGSGKTNAVGGSLNKLGKMIRAQHVFSEGWFIDIGKRGAGLDMYKDNFHWAIDERPIIEALHDIAGNLTYRIDEMQRLGLPSWPIGEVHKDRNGIERIYTAKVIVIDELQALLIHKKWQIGEFYLLDLFQFWARTMRAYGIFMMLYTQEARANKGVPTGLTGNINMRQCLRLKDRKLATEFMGLSGGDDFDRHPIDYDRGEFVLEMPFKHRGLIYGKTELAPHEVKRKRERGEQLFTNGNGNGNKGHGKRKRTGNH